MDKLKKTGFRITFEDGETLTRHLQALVEKEPFKIKLEANNKDRVNGLFGFDTIPKKDIVQSGYEKLKEGYKPLKKNILNKEYIPSWLSLRKNQTVELQLDWTKKEAADSYTTISFDSHPDFTFEPTNLKDAKTVKITCKNTNKAPAQITIKADNTLIVGALNIFYPKPKKAKLKWVIAEFNKNEFNKINKDINFSKLQEYFKKTFNPSLIDVIIENEKPYEINIPKLEAVTPTNSDNDIIIQKLIKRTRKHMDGDKKVIYTKNDRNLFTSFLSQVTKYNNNIDNNDTIVLILTKLKCYKQMATNPPVYANGFTRTGKGLCIMALGNPDLELSVDIPHEIMHALGLEHTFSIDSGYKILKGETDNLMDYNNTKEHTYKWQWDKLHKSKYSN